MKTNQHEKQQIAQTTVRQNTADEEIDLLEVMQTIWAGKWLIMGITAAFAIGSMLYALSQPNIYQAEAKLAPTKESQVNFGAFGGQLGGLASIAGINLPRGQVDNSQLAQEIMKSRVFLTDFVERREILPDLMAVDSWNPNSGQVTYSADVYDSATQTWLREVNPPRQAEPSSWEYVQEFRNILRVATDGSTGLVTVSIEHKSPVIAKQWVDWIIEDINNEMRRRDVDEAQSSIAFIEREMDNTRLANTQQVYASLLEQQTQTIMLANVRPEYVFRVIDPAVVPEQKAKPRRAVMVILGAVLGGILALFVVLIRSAVGKYYKDR
ncbi:LPS O-antigen length regulator [Aliidiomarina halalkaliphila]|uniref:LPS O-antigen length regulator n=1 Tax=Aliidiomarina halalkaliphila TaxID=2593535 RepID=A0A552X6L9_9GAMM|nr:Wzz/FepE/Etk N-terminal domain-containing protein [Aliidiomarina halalkaliphila]TRW50203.1 LPS O-antigen length regulator [Aliidiomarina halalkaliphila]